MRIFGRSKITKPAAPAGMRRRGAAEAAAVLPYSHAPDRPHAAPGASESYVQLDLAATDEMPIVREFSPSTYPAVAAPDVVESQTGGEDGDSDVFVCRRSSPPASADADLRLAPEAAAAAAAAEAVTLYVYGWDNVEPGPLSWAFPSLRAALDAVKTMRNAIEWCIVAGHEWSSMDAARESGAVLIEQNA